MDRALLDWCKFIVSPETLDKKIMEENKNIERAKEVLDKLSQDEQERDLAYRREKAIRDINVVRQSGYSDGKKEGIEQGTIQRTFEIARNMLKEKFNIETITKITGLSKDEIEKIK